MLANEIGNDLILIYIEKSMDLTTASKLGSHMDIQSSEKNIII